MERLMPCETIGQRGRRDPSIAWETHQIHEIFGIISNQPTGSAEGFGFFSSRNVLTQQCLRLKQGDVQSECFMGCLTPPLHGKVGEEGAGLGGFISFVASVGGGTALPEQEFFARAAAIAGFTTAGP